MLHTIRDIIREAGDVIMKVYRAGSPKTMTKDDGSPVTEADLESHNLIERALTQHFNLPVISEEGVLLPYSERKVWNEVFLVDPLDGTKDFLARNGEFTINIALIRDGIPHLGLVYLPALNELFYSERGAGAWLEQEDKPIRLPDLSPATPTLARARFYDNAMVEQFAKENEIQKNVRMSSAVRLPRLAQGVVNLVLTSNRASEWDVAAGHLLVHESGGRVSELDSGQEPVYNKPDIKSARLLATNSQMTKYPWKLPL